MADERVEEAMRDEFSVRCNWLKMEMMSMGKADDNSITLSV